MLEFIGIISFIVFFFTGLAGIVFFLVLTGLTLGITSLVGITLSGKAVGLIAFFSTVLGTNIILGTESCGKTITREQYLNQESARFLWITHNISAFILIVLVLTGLFSL